MNDTLTITHRFIVNPLYRRYNGADLAVRSPEQRVADRMEFLKHLSLFARLNDAELTALAKDFTVRHFQPGETIFFQGDPGQALYLIEAGRVRIYVQDDSGQWWYRLQDGIAYSPGPYALATSLRYLSPAALASLSSDRTDKKIVVDLARQEMTCFEGETPILSARAATGFGVHRTPRGEYEVLRKSHTSYMIGGVGSDHYDLPGVSFPTYFTRTAIAVHGTYWHNDYGRPRSHGCVNVLNDAAQFVFRWSTPAVPYDQHQIMVKRGEGTKVVVV